MNDETTSRSDLVRTLTSAGWLAFTAWLLFLFRQIGRVARVGEGPFAGVWEQRIEVLSFVVLPPNSLMLVPAAVLACVTTWLSGPTMSLALAVQLRIVRWAAVFQIAVGAMSIVSIVVNETGSPTESLDIAQRLSGALMAFAVVKVTSAVEQQSPGGSPRS